jgi:hypothetical protein
MHRERKQPIAAKLRSVADLESVKVSAAVT